MPSESFDTTQRPGTRCAELERLQDVRIAGLELQKETQRLESLLYGNDVNLSPQEREALSEELNEVKKKARASKKEAEELSRIVNGASWVSFEELEQAQHLEQAEDQKQTEAEDPEKAEHQKLGPERRFSAYLSDIEGEDWKKVEHGAS